MFHCMLISMRPHACIHDIARGVLYRITLALVTQVASCIKDTSLITSDAFSGDTITS